MPAAVSGKGGSNTLLRVARALAWGLELSSEQSVGLLTELYSPRCDPPWTDAEIVHKVPDASGEDGAPYKRGALLPLQAATGSCAELLTTDNKGNVEDTAANVATLLQFHPDWAGGLRYDAFAGRVICATEPPARAHDRPCAPA